MSSAPRTFVEAGHFTRGVVLGQMLRFGIVGVGNTVLSWFAYAVMVHVGVAILLASAIAWTFGALNSYALNRRWTFRSRGRYTTELLRFGAVQSVGLVLDLILLDALTGDAGIHHLIAQALVYPATTVATFLLVRHWAFAPPGSPREWPV